MPRGEPLAVGFVELTAHRAPARCLPRLWRCRGLRLKLKTDFCGFSISFQCLAISSFNGFLHIYRILDGLINVGRSQMTLRREDLYIEFTAWRHSSVGLCMAYSRPGALPGAAGEPQGLENGALRGRLPAAVHGKGRGRPEAAAAEHVGAGRSGAMDPDLLARPRGAKTPGAGEVGRRLDSEAWRPGWCAGSTPRRVARRISGRRRRV